jgi:lysozyme
MQCGPSGIALIKQFEKCELISYPDVRGIWTIGWGQTGPWVTKGLTCTQGQADMWLQQAVDKASAALTRMIKVPVTQNQFDALVCWAYNIGLGAAASSSAIATLNQGHTDDVPRHMALYDEVTINEQRVVNSNLVARRAAESELYETA